MPCLLDRLVSEASGMTASRLLDRLVSEASGMTMPRLRALAAAAALAALPAAGAGAEWNWRADGLVDARVRAGESDATRLVPEPDRIGRGVPDLSATVVAGAEAWRGPLAASGRLRARGVKGGGGRSGRLHVDELYAEYALTPERFLYAGRRNVVYGQSLGVNPLDVFLDPADIDRSKDTARRRSEIEGQDMFGFEFLPGERLTLGGYRTVDGRGLLAGTLTLPEWESDLTVLLFEDERPGAGLSFSRTLGEAVLIYADAAVRRGRDRPVIRADRRSGAGPGTFLAMDGEGDRDRFFPQSSAGVGYALPSGAGFNLEHYFDANGYTSGEWREITDLIAENGALREEGRSGGLPLGNLLRLGARLDRFTLRRHYAFLRVQHPGLLDGVLAAEATAFHNLADHGGALGLRVEHEHGPNLLFGVQGRYLYGKGMDEFALRAVKLSGSVYVTVNF